MGTRWRGVQPPPDRVQRLPPLAMADEDARRDSTGRSASIFAMGMPLNWRDTSFRDMLGHSVAVLARLISVLVPRRFPEASVAEERELTEWDELEAAMTTWGEKLMAKGRTQGRVEGRTEGRVGLLVSMARERFGEPVAGTISGLLGSVRTESSLDEVGTWLLTCETGDALIAKIRQM